IQLKRSESAFECAPRRRRHERNCGPLGFPVTLPAMKFSSLASGSKANCTFVEAGGTRILIDNGLSAKNALGRLSAIGIDPATIDALLVTHEHSDHIKGVQVLSKQLRIP